jgi:hypothetical protein
MKKVSYLAVAAIFVLTAVTSSCKKESCHTCHYEDASNKEVELGEKCGDELEALEKDGYTVNGTKYEVHCHDH